MGNEQLAICANHIASSGMPADAARRNYEEIYTGDTLAPERRRHGLGTEPMSCPPNAFQSGEGVIRLEPGASVTTRWGARLQ